MVDSQKFYRQNHEALIRACHRMEEDEQIRSSIQASNQDSQRCSLFFEQRDSVPFIIIHDYTLSQTLMSATGSSFTQMLITELKAGLRVDRFLALAIQWLLRADLRLSSAIRTLINNLLRQTRHQAVS